MSAVELDSPPTDPVQWEVEIVLGPDAGWIAREVARTAFDAWRLRARSAPWKSAVRQLPGDAGRRCAVSPVRIAALQLYIAAINGSAISVAQRSSKLLWPNRPVPEAGESIAKVLLPAVLELEVAIGAGEASL